MLKCLPKTKDNYEVAIRSLKEKYGNKQLLVTTLMNKLNTMRPVNLQIAGSLNYFVETVNMNIEALKSAGIALTQVDLSITLILLKKLPLNSKRKFIENLKDGTWTIKALI